MKKEITLLDGAVGTSLWKKAEDRGLEKVPVWRYNIEHPELVFELCREYIDAGSKIILGNTFGANRDSVRRASDHSAGEVVREGIKICKEAAKGTDVRVGLSIGPLSTLLEPYGDTTEEEATEIFSEQISAGMDAGADIICIQTFMDVEMTKLAAKVAKSYSVPVFCTMTFEKVGKTIMGNSVRDCIEALEPLGVDAIGMNCSLGPDLALPVIREFKENTNLPLIFKPNAGKPKMSPDGKTVTDYDAKVFAKEIAPALEFVDYVGGCCGCDPEYVRELNKLLK